MNRTLSSTVIRLGQYAALSFLLKAGGSSETSAESAQSIISVSSDSSEAKSSRH